jgi:hypothetical protein
VVGAAGVIGKGFLLFSFRSARDLVHQPPQEKSPPLMTAKLSELGILRRFTRRWRHTTTGKGTFNHELIFGCYFVCRTHLP